MDANVTVLLVGSGAREHVIAKKLKEEEGLTLVSVMSSNNPGIKDLSDHSIICSLDDFSTISSFAIKHNTSFAVIGPEAPLAQGIVDMFLTHEIPCVGPTKDLAQLESSKAFTRNLMEKFGIPGLPRFMVFKKDENILTFMKELDGVVVKPDGLTGGKGVRVQGDHFETKEEGYAYAKELINSGNSVVVEEKLIGEEFSLQSFCDGRTVIDCPPVQDHKRAYPDDKGPNTGGMGSYSDSDHSLPFLKPEHVRDAHRINEKIAEALYRETGTYYKGILYGGFIVTKNGIKLIEYNARFGDPEAMNVLPLLKTSLASIFSAMIDGTLNTLSVTFEKAATVCKYVVPEGYPQNPLIGEKISIGEHPGELFYASVDQKEDGLFMTGSRACAFVGIGATLNDAEAIAQKSLSSVSGKVYFREDIGTDALIQKRIDHMKELLGD